MKPQYFHTLMVQGTTSDAGKSILAAGICRVLSRRGLSVAPFKPQNMALNSAVTVDGGEIGRAQAVQAQACGIAPHTDMNPVLLKPSSDTGAQVIVQGKALDNMEAVNFHDYKATAMAAVLDSYQKLKQCYDVIVVEGAGSPAEINLRENDIANMGFAEAVDCPVIIIADIDRGGVFAHLVGTLALLSESEQKRVVGFVINRFRGDIALLQSGLDWLEDKTDKPVLGVIPYLMNFYLDAEDAIASFSAGGGRPSENDKRFKVVVPVFSRISNHTDFDALQLRPDIDLCFVGPGQQLPEADLIILPGSKNVRKDLTLVKEYKWDKAIMRHLRYGGKVLGICGGYQMLGQTIIDHEGIEDSPGVSCGLGLFNISTTLTPKKILQNVTGRLNANIFSLSDHDTHRAETCDTSDFNAGALLKGYEIHCGVTALNITSNTSGDAARDLSVDQCYSPFIQLEGGRYDGAITADNLAAGTYMHGLFDEADAANAILTWAGLSVQCHTIDLHEVREQQLERLADCLEETLQPTFFSQFDRGMNT